MSQPIQYYIYLTREELLELHRQLSRKSTLMPKVIEALQRTPEGFQGTQDPEMGWLYTEMNHPVTKEEAESLLKERTPT